MAAFRLLVFTILVAVLVSVAAAPVVLISGALARAGVDRIEEVPPLPVLPLPQRSTLLAADGSLLANVFLQNRIVVDLEAVSPLMRSAVVAVEDERFYSHRGVDVRGTARALVSNAASSSTQGGSTITQQFVKNILAASAGSEAQRAAATAKTYQRKLLEAHYALELETSLTKDEILEGYLNIAYFGEGAYGVEAAAQTYFGRSAAELDLAQAAALAASVQQPSSVNPVADPEATRARRDVVLELMADQGLVSPVEAAAATASDLVVSSSPPPNGCSASPYPFYCEWALSTLASDPALGATPDERANAISTGGLTIVTSLDPATQVAAQVAVDRLPRAGAVAAATVIIEPGTGAVRALALNRDYGTEGTQTVLDLASRAHASAASTFKVFTLAAALESGITLDTVLPGGAAHTSTVFENPAAGFYSNAEGSARSNLRVDEAMRVSSNTAFVQLLERVSVASALDVAARAGITSIPVSGPTAPRSTEGSFTLGAREVSVLELANAYATFAAHGVACVPAAVLAVNDVPAAPRCEQVIAPAVADTVAAVLASAVTDGTGSAAAFGRPVAGKTGTANDFGAAWFAGFTPQLASAVWVGDPRGPSFPLFDVDGVSRVFGGTIPAEMFAVSMGAAHASLDVVPLPVVDQAYVVAVGPPVMVDVVGVEVRAALAALEAEGVEVVVDVVDARAGVAPGTVVASNPPAGERVRGQVMLSVTAPRS